MKTSVHGLPTGPGEHRAAARRLAAATIRTQRSLEVRTCSPVFPVLGTLFSSLVFPPGAVHAGELCVVESCVVCRDKAAAEDLHSLTRQVSDKVDQSWVERRIEPKVSKDDVEQVSVVFSHSPLVGWKLQSIAVLSCCRVWSVNPVDAQLAHVSGGRPHREVTAAVDGAVHGVP